MSDFKATANQPCWIQIAAFDVKRAAAFYKTVLAFDLASEEPKIENGSELLHFGFPGGPMEKCLGGGIVAREKGWPEPPPTGPATVYFYVEDLEGTMEAVEKAGGKALKTRTGCGTSGYHADFKDTEGNIHGLYTSNPKA